MKICYKQIKKIHGLLPKEYRGDRDYKARLVRQFAGPNSKSVKDLDYNQANMLIKHLGGTAITYENWGRFEPGNSAHMKVLSLCHQLEWTSEIKGRIRPDTHRLSEWLKSDRSPVRKPMMDQTKHELSKVIHALESMYNKQHQKDGISE